jgi:hypothetical protein
MSVSQTLSLALSLLEAAPVLDDCDSALAHELRQRAHAYLDGVAQAPHDPARGVFASRCGRDTGKLLQAADAWGIRYGKSTAAPQVHLLLGAHRLTQRALLLELAEGLAGPYEQAALPADVVLPARDPATVLAMLADLYELTGASRWQEPLASLAEEVTQRFLDRTLPRGSLQTEVYEAQLATGSLLHALARAALLTERGRPCPLASDYSLR